MSETPQGPGWWLASDGRYYPPESAPAGSPQRESYRRDDAPAYGTPSGQPTAAYGSPQQYPTAAYGSPQEYPTAAYGPPQQYPPAAYPPAGPGYAAPAGYPPGPSAPGQQPYQPGPQPYQPGPQPYQPGPPRRSRGRGCITALVIVVVLVVGLALAGRWALGRASNWFGAKKDELVGGSACPYITDAEVGSLVGGKVTLVKAGGLTSIVSSVVDSRVIPQAPSCWAMSDSTSSAQDPGRLMRIADRTGADAATVFKAEVTKAKGVTVNKGNGLSVSTESYYNKPVSGLGNEAFCTSASTSGPGSAGVLVRKGNRLVYVSLTPDFSKGAPGIGTPGRTTLSTDDESCALAQKIARVVLTH